MKLEDLFRGSSDPITNSRTPLCRLWRLYIYKSDIKLSAWQARFNKHLQRVQKEEEQSKEKAFTCLTDYKGNLTKALRGEKLPWKRFCIGMGIIAPDGYDVTFDLTMNGKHFKRTIRLGHTYKEETGVHLKDIWNDIKEEFPDETVKDWKKHIAKFAKDKIGDPEKSSYLLGYFKTAHKEKHITYKTFFRSIEVLPVEEYSISVTAIGVTATVKKGSKKKKFD